MRACAFVRLKQKTFSLSLARARYLSQSKVPEILIFRLLSLFVFHLQLTNKIKKNARMAATDATHVATVSEDETVHFSRN